jgi:hypothetical protein
MQVGRRLMSEGFVEIGFDVMGETQVARTFALADELASDMSEPLGELMDQLLSQVELQFDTQGAAGGSTTLAGSAGVLTGARWAPLSDEYGAWKAEHYPGWPILVRDGGMKRAMLDRQAAVHVSETEAVYEPISEIAGFHQSGADWIGPAWGRGEVLHHLPQRKIVDLSEEWKHEHVDRTFARWIARSLAEARGSAVPLAA